MGNPVQIRGRGGRVVEVDNVGAIVTANTDVLRNREVIQGAVYTASIYNPSVAINGVIEMVLITPDPSSTLINIEWTCSDDATLSIFEDADLSDNGTAVSRISRNQGIGLLPDLLVFEAPTINADGTLVTELYAMGKGQTGIFVLDNDTTYLIRLKNDGGNNKPFQLSLDWID